MSDKTDKLEADLLGCCYLDPDVIDRALSAGITRDDFGNTHYAEQFHYLCRLRLAGHTIATDTVYAQAVADGILDRIGGLDAIMRVTDGVPTSAHAAAHINAVLTTGAQRRAYTVLATAVEGLKRGAIGLPELKDMGERVAAIAAGEQRVQRALADIATEAIRDAEESIRGDKVTRCQIVTGLPTFDRYATPMESHEYVVVGARTSHGKSSFLLQVAGHNLAHGKRIAIFSLETSDKAVLKQIVAQRAGVNLRQFKDEMPAKQEEYMEKLAYAKDTKNLLIFDRDLTLTAIEARCRLLANGYKPELVIIDYLGLIGVDGASPYERMSRVSKAMIPLRKALGCTLMVGAQLNRTVEKEEREPGRSDFRDAGGIEEDAHRVMALYRVPGQPLDVDWYDSAILQLKLRDGPLARINCRFHSPTTKFFEQTGS